ncbi:MAG: NAD-dependent epimerase/dehydratase family protein [Candidatus Marinimicrobia bacterium]|nr:NAD-dependent epimerase/dehydratase family protein [Candidatus Neomarinimicrobiota bacterium]
MNILVTGVAGFIGFHLTKRLCLEGFYVVGIDNMNDYYEVKLKRDRLKELDDYVMEGSFEYHEIDICDTEKLNLICEKNKFDLVINLAAQAGVRYSLENPKEYIRSNIEGFSNILEVCKEHEINRLIYASSSSVYGGNTKLPFSEEDRVDHPISMYATSKKTNELMAHTYSHLYNIQTIGLRFFTVYGPWGRPDMALNIFTKNIIEGKPLQIYNNGKHSRSFTYIDDIIESIYRLIGIQPDKLNKYSIFNIGGENAIELMDYISAIEDALSLKGAYEFLPMQLGDVEKTAANSGNLRDIIDFSLKTDIKIGINKFVDWYREYSNK